MMAQRLPAKRWICFAVSFALLCIASCSGFTSQSSSIFSNAGGTCSSSYFVFEQKEREQQQCLNGSTGLFLANNENNDVKKNGVNAIFQQIENWWENLIEGNEQQGKRNKNEEEEEREKNLGGTILRTAAKGFAGAASRASSKEYTTRKPSLSSISIASQGVVGDYNHYRTTALKSTIDRAISILTIDTMNSLKQSFPSMQEGDLGENILIRGISAAAMRVGDLYQMGPPSSLLQNPSVNDAQLTSVLVQITEPIVPCANLCTLPSINNSKFPPRERVQQCNNLLRALAQFDGQRGWYAKVIRPGTVRVGDAIRRV